MARSFISASGQNLEALTAAVTGQTFSMLAWALTTNAGLNQSVLWVGEDGDPTHFTTLQMLGVTGGDPCRLFKHEYGGTIASATTANGFSQNKWHHIAGIVASSTDMRCYLDGDVANKGVNTDTKPVSNHDATSIGHAADSTPGADMSGSIADVAFFDREITEDEIARAAAGFSAIHFDPVFFMALVDDADVDTVGGIRFTRSGSPPGLATHPALIYPPRVSYSFPAAPSFTPYPRPRGTRGGMLELVGGMH